DPFAVSLHAVLRAPPEPSQTALVYGCGSLGLMTILALRALFPATRVIAVSLDARQQSLVERLGAERLFTSRGRGLVGEIGGFFKGAAQEAAIRSAVAPVGSRARLRHGRIQRNAGDRRPRCEPAGGHRDRRRGAAQTIRMDADLFQGAFAAGLERVRAGDGGGK